MDNTKLSEIMTTELVTVKSNDTFNVVDDIFKHNGFHHLPVIDEAGKLVGILSKSDYLTLCNSFSYLNTQFSEKQNQRLFSSILVKEIMQKNIAKLKPDDTAVIAAGFFKENLFHAIPVVDNEDGLLGLVTTFDLLNLAFSEEVY